jgi:hypothetical protein
MRSLLDVSPCPACEASHVLLVEETFNPAARYAFVCPNRSECVFVGDVSVTRYAPGDIVPAGAILAGRWVPPLDDW